MATGRGDELIERLEAGHDDDGEAANALLKEVWAGYPVENLRRLVRSEQEPAAKSGAWLISELGNRAAPLRDELPALLGHRLPYVRFFAVDAVLAGATPGDGPVVARAIQLIDDSNAGVRWKVVNLLAHADADTLRAGLASVDDVRLRPPLSWLINNGSDAANVDEIEARLQAGDPTTRLFAAAAAARIAERAPSVLRAAGTVQDEEVRSFARDELARLERRKR